MARTGLIPGRAIGKPGFRSRFLWFADEPLALRHITFVPKLWHTVSTSIFSSGPESFSIVIFYVFQGHLDLNDMPFPQPVSYIFDWDVVISRAFNRRATVASVEHPTERIFHLLQAMAVG